MLKTILRVPQMYVGGDVNLDELDGFIHGWLFATQSREENMRFLDFQNWAHHQYSDRTTCGWRGLILKKYSNPDEATQEGLRLLREYCRSPEASSPIQAEAIESSEFYRSGVAQSVEVELPSDG